MTSVSCREVWTNERLLMRSDGGSDMRLPSVIRRGDVDQSLNNDRIAISTEPSVRLGWAVQASNGDLEDLDGLMDSTPGSGSGSNSRVTTPY